MLINKDEKRINDIIENVNASLSFEGLKPSKEATEINKRMLIGEITRKQARKMLLDRYKLATK